MNKKLTIMALSFALATIPLATSAQTVSATSASIGAAPTLRCIAFSRSLSLGAIGSDVFALQQSLNAQGFRVAAEGAGSPGHETDYFGPMTRAAVARWQAAGNVVTEGHAGSGIFGPLSRAHFINLCGGGSLGLRPGFYASPQMGTAPLTVKFTSSEPQGTALGNTVNFGDGTSGNLTFVPTCAQCSPTATVSHTYTSPGTYTATLTSGAPCACPANGICNCPMISELATTTVTVGPARSADNIQDVNAPTEVAVAPSGIVEVRNEHYYFTLENLTSSSATIQLTPVGCWNSFPSDTPPQIRCMIAVMPIPPQTLSVGQTYAAGTYSITLSKITDGKAVFSVNMGMLTPAMTAQ